MPAQTASIFMCYRRDDSADVTGRIYDRLRSSLGNHPIYRDVDAIPYGVDFRDHIHATLETACAVLIVIGPEWVNAGVKAGRRRLDDSRDHVRIEVEQSLSRKDLPVIPLLVRGAEVPPEDDLPESLRPLASRNGLKIRSDPDFHSDMDRLVRQLQRWMEQGKATPPKPKEDRGSGVIALDDSLGFDLSLIDESALDEEATQLSALDDDEDIFKTPALPQPAPVFGSSTPKPVSQYSPSAEPDWPIRAGRGSRRRGSPVLVIFLVFMTITAITAGVAFYVVMKERDEALQSSSGKPSPKTESALSAEERAWLRAQLRAATGTPATASKLQPFSNTLDMRFVPVPGTKVLFSVWETRSQDYRVFQMATGRAWTARKTIPAASPMVDVTWDDAQAFCEWLSRREKLTYRLPTDEEWSHAAGIGGKEATGSPKEKHQKLREFPWLPATQVTPPARAGNFADVTLSRAVPLYKQAMTDYDDGFAEASPVGSFEPNAWGLFDLAGNVEEWCADSIEATGSAGADAGPRVLRGGSFLSAAEDLLTSARSSADPARKSLDRGFRCVVELEKPGAR